MKFGKPRLLRLPDDLLGVYSPRFPKFAPMVMQSVMAFMPQGNAPFIPNFAAHLAVTLFLMVMWVIRPFGSRHAASQRGNKLAVFS